MIKPSVGFTKSARFAFATALMIAIAVPSPMRSSAQDSGAQLRQSTQSKPPQPAAAPSQAVLRAATHLVQINLIVQDKKGNPITDLHKEDFEIFDQGKPQTVGVFSMETTRVQPALLTPANPNIFSNRLEEKPGVPTSITVILIDALNTRFTDMAYARQQLTKFLQQLQPQDRVALYGLTTRLTMLHDFTNDAASLIASLNRTRNVETPQAAASDFDPANTGIDSLDTFLDSANQQLADFNAVNRKETTEKAMEAIANSISRLPGRKNLVWLSSGFPIDIGMDELSIDSTRDHRSFTEDVERAARTLNDANVAIYPVDARGLIGMPSTVSASSRGLTTSRANQMSSYLPDPKIFDTMNILADRTGGRAFYNTNGIKEAIRKSIDDSRVTYLLGYYPDHGQWNGKFHELKIKVNRAGTNMRYRKGYFAFSEPPRPDERKRTALLAEAVWSPVDASGLGLTVNTRAVDVPGAQTLKLTIKIDSRDFILDHEGERWVGGIDYLYIQTGDHDKVIKGLNDNVAMNLPQNVYEQVLKDNLTLSREIKILPGASQLRIVGRDRVSGATGSVTIPLRNLFPNLALK